VRLARATERTYQETIVRYNADLERCQAEIKKLKKDLALSSVVTPGLFKHRERKARDNMTREQRQMMNEVAHVVRSIVIRGVKFPFRGWNEYSDKPGTVCSMVMKAISFPPMSTDHDKKLIYVNFVQGLMPRMLTQSRNLITQHMRGQFNGEIFLFS
jgi:stalled ribosome alternative rescue factor ArfA